MSKHKAAGGVRGWALALLVVGVLGASLWLLLPRPYAADLGLVGEGRPALVLVFDPNLVVSGEQLAELDAARDTLAPRMAIILANGGRPDAARFIAHHDAQPGTLLFFGADGSLRQRLAPVVPASRLRSLID